YIRGNVRTPVLLVLATLTLQATLYLLLAPRLGIAGVSWAVAIGAYVQLVVGAWLVQRSERFGLGGVVGSALEVWIAAGIAVAAAALALRVAALGPGWFAQLASLALGGAVLLGVYVLVGLALRLPEVSALGRRLRR